MSDELAKVEDDLQYLSKLEEQGHNCGFYVELLYEYRNRLREVINGKEYKQTDYVFADEMMKEMMQEVENEA